MALPDERLRVGSEGVEGVTRLVQTGLVNQYAVAMLFGVLVLTFWFLGR